MRRRPLDGSIRFSMDDLAASLCLGFNLLGCSLFHAKDMVVRITQVLNLKRAHG